MNIADNDSPPALSQGSAASPPEELLGHYDERKENAVDCNGIKTDWSFAEYLGFDDLDDGDWRIRSRKDLVKGFVREMVWVKASQWEWS